MKRSENEAVRRPDTRDDATPWKLYNRLIEGIPEDIAVRDYCLGMHWSYVEADCGMGVSFTCKGGARRACKQDLRGTGLREMAELVAKLDAAWKQMGCVINSPYMTMALVPLACLPELRLTNRGLVDCRTFRFVPLFAEE